MREIISQTNDGVTIQVASVAPEGFFTLLDKIVWGTEGMLYTMHDLQSEVARLPEPYYVTLSENNDVIATMIFSKKTVFNLGDLCDVYYAALLAVCPEKRGLGYGTRLVSEATHFFLTTVKKCIVYAYVEEENKPSQKIFEKSGFDVIGNFIIPVYSRLSPKPDPRVARLGSENSPEMMGLLKDQYKGFALVDFDLSYDPGAYYVLRENGRIVAGLQFHQFHWTVTSVESWFAQVFLLKILPKTPFLRNLLDPAHYRFIKVGNFYTLEGHEDALSPIMQTLLHEYRLKSGVAYVSTRHPNHQGIFKAVKEGLLSSVTMKAYIYAYTRGLSEEEHSRLQQLPLNISMLDSI